MPRFAANIAYLYAERPLIERPGAAAAGGFTAVEGQFPYTTPASALRAAIERNKLTMLGINTERGGEGLFGLAAVPNREREFDALFAQALEYIVAVGGTRHPLSRWLRASERAAGSGADLYRKSVARCRSRGRRRASPS